MSIKKVDYHATNAAELFTQSIVETGFAVITSPPIELKFIHEVYKEWLQFFYSDEKFQLLFKKTQEGYFPITQSELAVGHSVKDIKEFYQIYPWGIYPQSVSDKARELYRMLNELGSTLLTWLQQQLPEKICNQFSMPLPDMVKDSPLTMLRILHYPPFTGDEEPGALRAAPHEDINILTLLVASSEPGLQILNKNNEWIDVGTDEGNIVINSGDMLQVATHNYVKATTHRVYNPKQSQNVSRLSMPLFLHPRNEVFLSHDLTAEAFLHQRRVENGVL